ncbi:hypothetical protein F2Q69_00013567 [Brassica cretica]|uniref:Uncharacterized protein n=1 Tax=Brassica cretica TaxID=69181 RepID=A0A8S9QZD7_BRACR|nr:hypothetical protein F2Q69_00013567 [Brassica cretica]
MFWCKLARRWTPGLNGGERLAHFESMAKMRQCGDKAGKAKPGKWPILGLYSRWYGPPVRTTRPIVAHHPIFLYGRSRSPSWFALSVPGRTVLKEPQLNREPEPDNFGLPDDPLLKIMAQSRTACGGPSKHPPTRIDSTSTRTDIPDSTIVLLLK